MIGIKGHWDHVVDPKPAPYHLLFLHGHHSSGPEMAEALGMHIRRELEQRFPGQFKLHFPDGPVHIPGANRSSWCQIQDAIVQAERTGVSVDPAFVNKALDAQVPVVRTNLIEPLLRREQIDPSQLFIAGFSVGACMVTRLQRADQPYGGMICFSGAFYAPPSEKEAAKTPILFSAGTAEGGRDFAVEAHTRYREARHPARLSLISGQKHEVSPAAIVKAVSFIGHCIREAPAAAHPVARHPVAHPAVHNSSQWAAPSFG